MPLLFAIFFLLLLPAAWGDDSCVTQARNDYERLYCQIKDGGEGGSLPGFADFRRNPPQTQALLLRRPARRLGLEMPEPPRGTAEPPRRQEAASRASTEPEQEPRQSGLEHCRLSGAVIRCGGNIFALVANQSNDQLPQAALTEKNQLHLPAYAGKPGDEPALRSYLVDAYQTYIEKMLSIGLGGSTMSFSRFYYTWQEVREQGGDFPRRMATMFTYLQRDKAAMKVQARYTEEMPESLAQCGRLSDRLVVCDRAPWNWVYERRGGG